jgi:hypothetical protein
LPDDVVRADVRSEDLDEALAAVPFRKGTRVDVVEPFALVLIQGHPYFPHGFLNEEHAALGLFRAETLDGDVIKVCVDVEVREVPLGFLQNGRQDKGEEEGR